MGKPLLIEIENLSEGMVLGEDVYGKFDLLVLKKGKKLSQQNISVLENQGLDFVYIEVATVDDNWIKEQYTEFQHTLHDVFQNSGQLNKTAKEKIESTLQNLIATIPQKSFMLMELKRLNLKDEYSARHCLNVALMAGMMGTWLQFSEDDIQVLMLAGALHDIGKAFIPMEILKIPGKLTQEQFEEVKNHSLYGYKKLSKVEGLPEAVVTVALEHHERLDGSGYPGGKEEDKIHFFSKIIAIVDIFDACTTKKVYGSRIHPLDALKELEENKNAGKIDSVLFKVFYSNIYKLFVGCTIKLDNGLIGNIAFFHKLSPNRPIIRVDGKLMNLAHHPNIEIVDIF